MTVISGRELTGKNPYDATYQLVTNYAFSVRKWIQFNQTLLWQHTWFLCVSVCLFFSPTDWLKSCWTDWWVQWGGCWSLCVCCAGGLSTEVEERQGGDGRDWSTATKPLLGEVRTHPPPTPNTSTSPTPQSLLFVSWPKFGATTEHAHIELCVLLFLSVMKQKDFKKKKIIINSKER